MYRMKELVSKLIIKDKSLKSIETKNLVNWLKTNERTEIIYM